MLNIVKVAQLSVGTYIMSKYVIYNQENFCVLDLCPVIIFVLFIVYDWADAVHVYQYITWKYVIYNHENFASLRSLPCYLCCLLILYDWCHSRYSLMYVGYIMERSSWEAWWNHRRVSRHHKGIRWRAILQTYWPAFIVSKLIIISKCRILLWGGLTSPFFLSIHTRSQISDVHRVLCVHGRKNKFVLIVLGVPNLRKVILNGV